MGGRETTASSAPTARRQQVRVLGHRGASAVERENTLAAFERAGELGADGVELDVWLLADGTLAVHHDVALADGRPLWGLGAADLPRHVPRLAEVLTICGARSSRPALEVNVEIKREEPSSGGAGTARVDLQPSVEAVAAAVVAELDRARADGFDGLLSVSSFDRASIDAVRALDPALPTGWLTAARVADWQPVLDELVAVGHRALHPHERLVTPALVEAARGRGLRLAVWTVNDPARMVELVGLGVDVLITDVVDVARAAVDGLAAGR